MASRDASTFGKGEEIQKLTGKETDEEIFQVINWNNATLGKTDKRTWNKYIRSR